MLLLIDSKSTTIQGFISTHFLLCFKDELKPNTIYKLKRFSLKPSKSVYRASPHKHTIIFTSKTTFAPVHEEGDYQIESQHFRLRDLQVFTDIVDKHTYLFAVSIPHRYHWPFESHHSSVVSTQWLQIIK
ncbi:uncharacterized protein LOC108837210 isoform X2 [Raphanus sativus]|uniref:Uncharacterized protein LOC108837210 isoform X2 n=1 Tax=Raphanus sativus TaxID=3726 RepID=A0A6J0LZY7_RAPSA|nr:uncharacterized protein LOC108837210 isoform X2 [Raphanus sativus]